MEIAVVGAGGWGTALSVMLASQGHRVSLWVRENETYKTIILKRRNEAFLPGIRLPDSVRPATELPEALAGKPVVIIAVPSRWVRETAAKLGSCLEPGALIVSAAKGLEQGSGLRMSQVLAQELPAAFQSRIAVISGPTHAEEVARNIPSATVVAAMDQAVAKQLQDILSNSCFRVYTNTDIAGVELGGALKNVIALGAGILDGLGLGDNTKAALITRGIAEITRLGVALGARPATFSGLSGLGDLIVTCASRHSRNRNVGLQLGRGKPLGEVLSGMKMVAEGVTATRVAYELAVKHGVEMPITTQIYRILFEGYPCRQALDMLMQRKNKNEIEDFAF